MGDGPKKILARFLAEDIGKGDISSALLPKKRITARIISRENGLIAGTKHAKQIFLLKGCSVRILAKDGCKIKPNKIILEISGTPQAILSCERTALNLLSRMSGIATQTNELVKKIPRTVGIFATRKTAPGLRLFDKEAVQTGGGKKHRMALDGMVMIKDNHIAVSPMEDLIRRAKKKHGKVEVEVENQKDAIIAVRLGADVIMLDNFTPSEIIRTITLLKKLGLRRKILIEVSGGINSKNISSFARTGADMISVGEITNSVKGIDFSLEI